MPRHRVCFPGVLPRPALEFLWLRGQCGPGWVWGRGSYSTHLVEWAGVLGVSGISSEEPGGWPQSPVLPSRCWVRAVGTACRPISVVQFPLCPDCSGSCGVVAEKSSQHRQAPAEMPGPGGAVQPGLRSGHIGSCHQRQKVGTRRLERGAGGSS